MFKIKNVEFLLFRITDEQQQIYFIPGYFISFRQYRTALILSNVICLMSPSICLLYQIRENGLHHKNTIFSLEISNE